MRTEDQAYFARRARQERALAENAPDPVSYKLHIELARQYEIRSRHSTSQGDDKAPID